MRLLGWFSTNLVFLAACGGNVVVDDAVSAAGAGGTSSASSTVGATTVTGGTGTGGGTVIGGSSGGVGGGSVTNCVAGPPQGFPAAYKACASTSDCFIELIPDCCKTFAVGVGFANVAAFEAYEAACVHLPMCDCEGPTFAEDGQSGNIEVACKGGLCMTYVP